MSIRLFFVGHGSANVESVSEFLYVVDLFRARCYWMDIKHWVLEFNKLSLLSCFGNAAKICAIVPLMLFSSNHVKKDLCTVSKFLQSLNKLGIVLLVDNLHQTLLTTRLFSQLIKALKIGSNCLSLNNSLIDLAIIMLFRGGSDLESNSLAYSFSRILWEGIGCLWCDVCFFGLTFPLINLKRLLALKQHNVIVIPTLLFCGKLYSSVCLNGLLVTGCLFSVNVSINLLFKHITRALFEFGLGGCALCKHKLLA
ncbi:MAG: CbiX/SirB N-terminal domain-containing protein [Candidatus Hodgkinia cicadicola]